MHTSQDDLGKMSAPPPITLAPYRARCTAAAVVYTNATPGYVAPPLPVVLGMIGAAVDAVVEEQGGAAVFGPLYRSLLNWGRSQYSTGDGDERTGDAEGGSGGAAGGGGKGSGLSSEGRLVLAIAMPCGVGLLAVATAAVLWRRNRRRAAALRRGRGVVVAPPGAGPATSLLVTGRPRCASGGQLSALPASTRVAARVALNCHGLSLLLVTILPPAPASDIQSSTGLWEHLDAGVMDRALSTHHAVMRKAIADWSGYESATEGDSFIVAFRSATDALMCALAAQQVSRRHACGAFPARYGCSFCCPLFNNAPQALLDAAWPEELLSAEPGLVPGLEAPDVDPLAQVGAVPVTASSK